MLVVADADEVDVARAVDLAAREKEYVDTALAGTVEQFAPAVGEEALAGGCRAATHRAARGRARAPAAPPPPGSARHCRWRRVARPRSARRWCRPATLRCETSLSLLRLCGAVATSHLPPCGGGRRAKLAGRGVNCVCGDSRSPPSLTLPLKGGGDGESMRVERNSSGALGMDIAVEIGGKAVGGCGEAGIFGEVRGVGRIMVGESERPGAVRLDCDRLEIESAKRARR